MTADFNVGKIYSAVERMDAYAYSLETIIVPPKERIAETSFFWKQKYTHVEIIAQAKNG